RDWSSDVCSSDLDPHFQILQTIILGRVARVLCSNLRSKRGAFTRTAETGTTGGRPGQYIALTIRDGDDRVVKGRVNVSNTVRHSPGYFLPTSAAVFLRHDTCLPEIRTYLRIGFRGPLRVRALVLVR